MELHSALPTYKPTSHVGIDVHLHHAVVQRFADLLQEASAATVEYEVLPDLSIGVEYQGRRLGRAIEDMSLDEGTAADLLAGAALEWLNIDGANFR